MKNLKSPCQSCHKNAVLTKLRMAWTDNKHFYKNSNRKFIMSTYYYLCQKCLKEKTKQWKK